jgi:hypothetical protein
MENVKPGTYQISAVHACPPQCVRWNWWNNSRLVQQKYPLHRQRISALIFWNKRRTPNAESSVRAVVSHHWRSARRRPQQEETETTYQDSRSSLRWALAWARAYLGKRVSPRRRRRGIRRPQTYSTSYSDKEPHPAPDRRQRRHRGIKQNLK